MQDEPNPPPGFEPLFRTSPFLETVGPLFYRRDPDQGLIIGLRIAEKHANARGIAHGENDTRDQQQCDGGADREFRAMPPHEFAQEVQPAGCASEDGLVREMPLDVHRQAIGGFVAPRAVLLQGLQDDAIEVAAKLGDEFLRRRTPAVRSSAFRRLSSG